jgi:AAA family ATP:ADP antiporter
VTDGKSEASKREDEGQPKGLIERALGVFSEVHGGEGGTVLLLTLNVFLILVAYYLLKVVREPLILTTGGTGLSGPQLKSYTTAGQAVLLIVLVTIYAEIAKKADRVKLITYLMLFFAACLGLFFILARLHVPKLGIAFYLWVGCFNVTAIAQFWSFANDLYTPEQGKRLFAIVGVGSSVGAMFGAQIAKWMYVPLGPYNMMLAAGAILVVCLMISRFIHGREKERGDAARRKEAAAPPGHRGGFKVIIEDKYLILLAALTLVLNVVNTTGEFILDTTVVATAKSGATNGLTVDQFIGTFKADFYFWVNTIGVVVQLFLVSRIFKYLGVRVAIFILPCIALGSYGLIAALPLLAYVKVGKLAENSTDYSVQNTARQALFLPTSREAKYSAKQFIDTFVVRIGDMASAGLVFVGTALSLGIRAFALMNLVLVVVWLGIVVATARLHKKRETEAEGKGGAARGEADAAPA